MIFDNQVKKGTVPIFLHPLTPRRCNWYRHSATEGAKEEKGKKKKEEKLPKGGEHPFDPKKHNGKDFLRDKLGRFLDKWGNKWEWDERGQHWDVQHPDGTHTNIGPGGDVHHGRDNF